MDRIIEVKGNGGYLSVDKRKAGNQHEANSTKLRITFDPGWDGYAKTVTFWDAKGQNPVKRTLTADLLENVDENTRVYLCPIPGEALAENGMMTFTIDGYVNGVRQRTVGAELEVTKSPYEENAGEAADPTPSQAEQLQAEIEALLGDVRADMVRAEAAAAAADQARIAAERARDASLEITGGEHVTMKDLKGKADVNHTHTPASIGAAAVDGQGVVPNGTDLSTLFSKNGWYMLHAGYTYINSPENAQWGVLTVKDKVATVQIINGKMYYAGNISATPVVWGEIYSSINRPTPADIGVAPPAKTMMVHDVVVAEGTNVINLNAGVHRLAGATVTGLPAGHSMWGTIQIARNRDYGWGTAIVNDIVTNRAWISSGYWDQTFSWHEIYTSTNKPTASAIGAAGMETGTYVGTGKAGSLYPNSLTFRFEPTVVMLGGYGVPNGVVFFKGATEMSVYANSFSQSIKFALSGKTLTWYNSSAGESESNTTRQMGQLNMLGETYTYVALG